LLEPLRPVIQWRNISTKGCSDKA